MRADTVKSEQHLLGQRCRAKWTAEVAAALTEGQSEKKKEIGKREIEWKQSKWNIFHLDIRVMYRSWKM